MALLQIAEPGQSAAPHEHRLAIGIDLGTTHSLVATVRSGLVEVIGDEAGRALLPSAVWYRADGAPVVGYAALAQRPNDPANVVVSVKRWMGRALEDLLSLGRLPYDFVRPQVIQDSVIANAPAPESDSGSPGGALIALHTPAGVRNAIEISADILRSLRDRAEQALGATPDINDVRHRELVGAVITVPAHFDDAQRQATKDAAQLAGLKVLRLLNEPTAAAIAYGLDQAAQGCFVVYDLGGGTFDVSILRLSRGVFEVLATGGDTALGGDDFDRALSDDLLERSGLRSIDSIDASFLLDQARAVKEQLSGHPTGSIHLHCTLPGGAKIDQEVSNERFEQVTAALLQRTVLATRRALRDAGLAPTDPDGVVLVGGATRMPAVRKAVAQLFGREPLTNLDPDQVVALGAAMQANLLAGNRAPGDDWLLLDVTPLSLGLETMGGLVERIIPRNSTLPAARAQEFTTFRDGQTAMAIHVVQGERERVADCRSLARFEVRGLPPMVAGAARISVSFQIDADGLLSVAAREASTGTQASVTVKPSYGLGDDAIAQMLRDAFGHAQEDAQLRRQQELKVDAQRLIEATRAALARDAELLATEERLAIEQAMERVVHQLDDESHGSADALGVATDALARATEGFAARRMDSAVRRALTGRRVDEIAKPVQ